MDFDDDRSKDEDTKIPVQGGVGEYNAAIPVVQNQFEVEGDPNENEVPFPRGSRNRLPPYQKDMDCPTLLTQQKKTCKNPSRTTKQLIHRKQKIGEKPCKQSTIH